MFGYCLNGGLPQPLVRPVLRVRSGSVWKGASFQVRPTYVRMRFASAVTRFWHGIAFACDLTAKDRDTCTAFSSWGSFNMLGEFDFSDKKLQDTTGVLPPKKQIEIIPENWKAPNR